MAAYDFDLIVIGAGSAGVRCARIAAGHGARVAIVEDRYFGGTCVNVGCVPKKLLAYGAQFGHDMGDMGAYGWELDGLRFDWRTLIANKDREIARLNGIYERILDNAGVTILNGTGRFTDAHTITVNGEAHTGAHIVIATGGWPTKPDVPGIEHAITSNEAFYLDRLPERVMVVGAGYIAVEFSGIFHGLGSEVIHTYRGEAFLRGFDRDVRQLITEHYQKAGIDVRLGTVPERFRKDGGRIRVSLDNGTEAVVDQVLCATGRHPNTAALRLDNAGVATDGRGAIQVTGGYQTNIDHIYALGDCTDTIQLTPVALAEGHTLADNLFGPGRRAVNYATVPSAVFGQPPIAACGLSEDAARRDYGAVDVYRTRFRPMKYSLSGRDEPMLMKLIVERARRRVVGVHILGADAPEMIQGFAVAMTAGATKEDFDRTIGLHPTAAEELVTMREPVPEDSARG